MFAAHPFCWLWRETHSARALIDFCSPQPQSTWMPRGRGNIADLWRPSSRVEMLTTTLSSNGVHAASYFRSQPRQQTVSGAIQRCCSGSASHSVTASAEHSYSRCLHPRRQGGLRTMSRLHVTVRRSSGAYGHAAAWWTERLAGDEPWRPSSPLPPSQACFAAWYMVPFLLWSPCLQTCLSLRVCTPCAPI